MERRRLHKHEDKKPTTSLLAGVILTISAIAHCALIGWAALSPVEPAPVPATARVQVQVYEHDEAHDTWSALGSRWARVSRDKLAP